MGQGRSVFRRDPFDEVIDNVVSGLESPIRGLKRRLKKVLKRVEVVSLDYEFHQSDGGTYAVMPIRTRSGEMYLLTVWSGDKSIGFMNDETRVVLSV